jgi:hypothetical protein
MAISDWSSALNIKAGEAVNLKDSKKSTISQILEIVKTLVAPTAAKFGDISNIPKWNLIGVYDAIKYLDDDVSPPIRYPGKVWQDPDPDLIEKLLTLYTPVPNQLSDGSPLGINPIRGTYLTKTDETTPYRTYYTDASFLHEYADQVMAENDPDQYYLDTVTKRADLGDKKRVAEVLDYTSKTPWLALRAPKELNEDLGLGSNSLFMIITFEYPATIVVPNTTPKTLVKKVKNVKVSSTTAHTTTVTVDNSKTNSVCVYFLIEDGNSSLEDLSLSTEGFGKLEKVAVGPQKDTFAKMLIRNSDPLYQSKNMVNFTEESRLLWSYQENMGYNSPAEVRLGIPKIHMSISKNGYFWAATSTENSQEFDFFMAVLKQDNADTISTISGNKSVPGSQAPEYAGLTTYVGNVIGLKNLNSKPSGAATVNKLLKYPIITKWLTTEVKTTYTHPNTLAASVPTNSRFLTFQKGYSDESSQYYYYLPTVPLQFGNFAVNAGDPLAETFSTDILTSVKNRNNSDRVTTRAYSTFPTYMFDWCNVILESPAGNPTQYIRTGFGLLGTLEDIFLGSKVTPQGIINIEKSTSLGHVFIGSFWFPIKTTLTSIKF